MGKKMTTLELFEDMKQFVRIEISRSESSLLDALEAQSVMLRAEMKAQGAELRETIHESANEVMTAVAEMVMPRIEKLEADVVVLLEAGATSNSLSRYRH